MKQLKIKIQRCHYLALACFCKDTLKNFESMMPEDEAIIPDYYFTIAAHSREFAETKLSSWRDKNGSKYYTYKVSIDLAIAYIRYIDLYRETVFPHQELKDKLFQEYINAGFSFKRFKSSYELA